jgi:hypothetical protein
MLCGLVEYDFLVLHTQLQILSIDVSFEKTRREKHVLARRVIAQRQTGPVRPLAVNLDATAARAVDAGRTFAALVVLRDLAAADRAIQARLVRLALAAVKHRTVAVHCSVFGGVLAVRAVPVGVADGRAARTAADAPISAGRPTTTALCTRAVASRARTLVRRVAIVVAGDVVETRSAGRADETAEEKRDQKGRAPTRVVFVPSMRRTRRRR